MHSVVSVILGASLILFVLWDAFETVILPRRVTRKFRFARLFYRSTWRIWSGIANLIKFGKKRETYLSYYGPLSFLFLLTFWAGFLVCGYSFLYWGLGKEIKTPEGAISFLTCLYFSGTTFFTLGLGDVQPLAGPGRLLAVLESGMGFGFLAILISYIPTLNQSFSRREVNISLLDARAGSPPSASEMILRHTRDGRTDALTSVLAGWERWSAELLESHLSYPVLAYYRSQHDNQSWLAALTSILDTCAFSMVNIEGACAHQARLTFAMARHAIVDLALVLRCPPREPRTDRLPPSDLDYLRAVLKGAGLSLFERDELKPEQQMKDLRGMYEPYVNSLSDRLCMAIPPWIAEKTRADNWQVSAWGLSPGLKETDKQTKGGGHF